MSGKFISLHASRVCLRMPDNIFEKAFVAALTKVDEWKRFLANTRPLAEGLIPAISEANYDTSPILFRCQRQRPSTNCFVFEI